MINGFIRRLFYLPPKYPESIQISITNRCNFNCQMCQRYDLKVPIKDMDLVFFTKIMEKIPQVKNIILTGWGEPFIHPQIITMIKMAEKKAEFVRLTTNGSLLDDRMIKNILGSRLGAITFSIDEINRGQGQGHKIANQLKNLEKLIQEKNKAKSKLKIYIQAVYQKGREEDIFQIAEYAVKIGLDRLRITRLDIRFQNLKRPNIKEEKKLIKELEKKLKKTPVKLDFLPYVALDGLPRFIYKIIYPLFHRWGKYCLRTYSDVYININGCITPCCALPLYRLGDILEEDLLTVWNSEKFKNFRKNQNHICGRCDILRIKTYNQQ